MFATAVWVIYCNLCTRVFSNQPLHVGLILHSNNIWQSGNQLRHGTWTIWLAVLLPFLFWEEWTLVSAFHSQMIYFPQKTIFFLNKPVEVKLSLAYQLCPERQFVIHYNLNETENILEAAWCFTCTTWQLHIGNTLKKNRVGMRQCASNFSDMLISYSLYARNRSVEQAGSAADTSNFQYPDHSPCFSYPLSGILLRVQLFCQ